MTAEKWHSFTLAQQMGNIGSEVHRAFSWKEKGENLQAEKAIDRFLELIDLTLTDIRWRGRCLEIARLREVLCDCFFANNSFSITKVQMDNYFIPFALFCNKNL